METRVTCVIPAYNEEKFLKDTLSVVKKVKGIDEIIVVDDGSTDKTFSIAKAEGVRLIRHKRNRGKGSAIKTGYKKARGEVILFLDADVQSFTPKAIRKIFLPILKNEADFVKTCFCTPRGRLAELVVKPLLKVIFPKMNFKQPISGQFAIKKSFTRKLKIDNDWSVDIQILMQMIKRKARIKEVNIGKLVHRKQPLKLKKVISKQVIKAILEERGLIAHKHKLIIFDLDKTLIKERSVEVLAREFGFQKKLKVLREKYRAGQIKDFEIARELANELKGKTPAQIKKVCEKKMHLQKNTGKIILRLKQRRYKLAIASLAFSPVANYFAKKLKIKRKVCPILAVGKKGRFTGRVISQTGVKSKCCGSIVCKRAFVRKLREKMKLTVEQCVAVGDGASDKCLFEACGLALAISPKRIPGTQKISSIAEVLVYTE